MFDRLIPPDKPERVTQWRYFVAGAVVLLLLNAFAGRVGLYGFGAYASASELREQSEKIDVLLELSIAKMIRELRREECRSNGNKAAISRTIDDYQRQYREVTGERYPVPPCERFIE